LVSDGTFYRKKKNGRCQAQKRYKTATDDRTPDQQKIHFLNKERKKKERYETESVAIRQESGERRRRSGDIKSIFSL